MRPFLGTQGMKRGDIPKFIEEAARWRVFNQTLREAREAFADVPEDELQRLVDEAVDRVRARRNPEHTES